MIQTQTGVCEKCDRALEKIISMMVMFPTFDAFHSHFKKVADLDDKDKMILWLLRALYVLSREKGLGPVAKFEELLDILDDDGRDTMIRWVNEKLDEKKKGSR